MHFEKLDTYIFFRSLNRKVSQRLGYFIAGNLAYVSEIARLMIVFKLEEYDYDGATAVAAIMFASPSPCCSSSTRRRSWSRAGSVLSDAARSRPRRLARVDDEGPLVRRAAIAIYVGLPRSVLPRAAPVVVATEAFSQGRWLPISRRGSSPTRARGDRVDA